MASISYPSGFPIMRLEGMQTERISSVVRTEMDAGPAKARQRYTVSSKYFSGSVILTSDQRTAFEYWYKNTLGNGVLRFNMTDPQTLDTNEFRFAEDYGEESVEGLWKITMKLEKMNA